MTTEQVVLQMVANRLEMLLDQFSDLKTRYSGEMTEIINLAKGVITEQPSTAPGSYAHDAAPAYFVDDDGHWHLPLTDDMVDLLYNTQFPWRSDALTSRITQLHDQVFSEPDEPGYDDNDDPDDGLPLEMADALENPTGVAPEPFYGAGYDIVPEMPNDQS